MSTTVNYKGSVLTTVENQTKTLKTAGKYMEGDLTIVDVTRGGGVVIHDTIDSHGGTIREITADSAYTIDSLSVTSNGIYDAPSGFLYDSVSVAVPSSAVLQTKTATPTESVQTITPDSGYNGLSSVEVGAISSTYVGSGITRRSVSDLSVSANTVTTPAGYYQQTVGTTVANGTAGTPTTIRSVVSNNSVTITPTVTNTTGYITGETKSGTAETVTASDLVSGTKSIDQNGTGIDVTNYQYVDVAVSGGSSKNVQIAAGVNRVATTSYTAVSGQTLTVAITGTYDVYWSGYRSSTSGTNGSQLYIGNTAYGSAQTTFSNNGQSVHLTNVSLNKNDVITVRARARGTSYYMYVSNLTIIQN